MFHTARMNLNLDDLIDTVADTVQQHYPTHHWAQFALGMLMLVLAALFAQWVVARIVLYFAHRLLVLTERQAWDKSLARHRAYHQLWYAVPFAAVAIGISEVPHIGHVADFDRARSRMPAPGSACSSRWAARSAHGRTSTRQAGKRRRARSRAISRSASSRSR
jgi:hypothetical protein